LKFDEVLTETILHSLFWDTVYILPSSNLWTSLRSSWSPWSGFLGRGEI